jgi:hypothetical protein
MKIERNLLERESQRINRSTDRNIIRLDRLINRHVTG